MMALVIKYIIAPLALALLCAVSLPAQVTNLSPEPKIQFFDNNGAPLAGGFLYSYASGTSTPLATYTDSTGASQNTNPVILDASGRCNLWLGSLSYKLVLQDANHLQIWSVDNVTAGAEVLLGLNNFWTAGNTFQATTVFNGSVYLNNGFIANGYAIFNDGGSLTGTFAGTPTWSGLNTFNGGIAATTGTFSGQITSTLLTGTPAFVIASTTQIPNLDASLLETFSWEAPGTIGSTTPNTGVFSTLTANGALTAQVGEVLNGPLTGSHAQGTDTNVPTSGTFASGAANPLCTDSNGGITTTGCVTTHHGSSTSVCTTSGSSYATCSFTLNWTVAEAGTSYVATCTGVNPTQFPYIVGYQSRTTSGITVIIGNGTSNGAMASTYGEVDCIAVP